MNDTVKGYEIKRAIVFENGRGFALGENPQAVQPFVTWQFTEGENGKRDYYWGHYFSSQAAATKNYEFRVFEHQYDYDVTEKSAYKYYSTQRPVDIGTFPKTENGPLRHVNFDRRELVEQNQFKAWGYLVYDAPLTEKQIDDYELRAAPDNPDVADNTHATEKRGEKKSIAAKLAEGAKQAAKENASHPTAPKDAHKDR